MNTRILPVTLAVGNQEERMRLEGMIENMHMTRLQPEDAESMGVLVYEPGPSAEDDFPHIFHALESGQAEDVYLAGEAPESELLIRAMRNGIREFLKFPITEEDLRAALMRTAMRGSLEEDGPRGHVVTVLGSKAGLGVTTIAVNLACAINENMSEGAALLDLRQPVGETPLFLDLHYDFTWGELVKDISRLDATYLRSVMCKHSSGLKVLPAPSRSEKVGEQDKYMILEHMRQAFPVAVVDASPLEEDELPKEVELADTIVLVTDLSMPGLARTARLMKMLRTQDPDTERRIHLVVNRFTKDSGVNLAEAEEVLEKSVSWVVPEGYSIALSALNQGVPLIQSAPKSPTARAFRKMAKHFSPEQERCERKGFSLFGLFRKAHSEAEDSGTGNAVRMTT